MLSIGNAHIFFFFFYLWQIVQMIKVKEKHCEMCEQLKIQSWKWANFCNREKVEAQKPRNEANEEINLNAKKKKEQRRQILHMKLKGYFFFRRCDCCYFQWMNCNVDDDQLGKRKAKRKKGCGPRDVIEFLRCLLSFLVDEDNVVLVFPLTHNTISM